MARECTIYYTSDTHGCLFPTVYASRGEKPTGLFNCAAAFRKNGNTLVLDGGDTLQGSPLAQYYLAHPECCAAHPMAAAFNAAGCDYFTLGNHDFNYGYDALCAYITAMDAVCVCANVADKTGRMPIRSHVVHTLQNGLRVGVTGVVTDFVNVWERPENLEKLTVTDAFEAAARECAALKAEGCDVTVCIYHGGFERDLATGEVLADTGENMGWRIAEKLSYDVLLSAHQHMSVESAAIGGTHTVQVAAIAVQYARLTVREAPVQGLRADSVSLLCPAGAEHAPEPYHTLLPLENKVQAWLDEPVGRLETPVEPEEKLHAALCGSRVADLFNEVQLAATGADFSSASLGNTPVGLKTPVTMRDITAAYPFANTLVVLEVNETVLRALLERCAAYFTVEDGAVRIADAFLKPKVEHYNYDFFAGFSYAFDVSRPVGSRVVRMEKDGKPLSGKYTLCVNSYRATGTGGYAALRKCRVVSRLNTEVPELITAHIRRAGTVQAAPKTCISVQWSKNK